MQLYKSDTDYLFVENGEIIGECSVKLDDGLYIEWIEVYEPFRHKGYFHHMLKTLFNEFQMSHIRFYCKGSLVKMYEHMGARVVQTVDSRGSADMILEYCSFM